MPCIDERSRGVCAPDPGEACDGVGRRRALSVAAGGVGLVGLAFMSGCTPSRNAPPGPPPASAPAPKPTFNAPSPAAPSPSPSTSPARNWADYQVQAARRLVQANPDSTYMGTPPDPLLAIPVLEVELYVDGSIQSISVRRQPSQATDTVQLAIKAVRRAAPFPPVAHLPKPWRFTEVFLFDERRRFKPRTLDN